MWIIFAWIISLAYGLDDTCQCLALSCCILDCYKKTHGWMWIIFLDHPSCLPWSGGALSCDRLWIIFENYKKNPHSRIKMFTSANIGKHTYIRNSQKTILATSEAKITRYPSINRTGCFVRVGGIPVRGWEHIFDWRQTFCWQKLFRMWETVLLLFLRYNWDLL